MCKPQDNIINDYNKVFKDLINVVKTYGGTFDKLGLVLLQLAKNGAVAGADGDIIGADNPAQIGATKEIVSESMKAAILLDRANGQKYKQLKDDLEIDFNKGIENYATTVERAVRLLNTYTIKF